MGYKIYIEHKRLHLHCTDKHDFFLPHSSNSSCLATFPQFIVSTLSPFRFLPFSSKITSTGHMPYVLKTIIQFKVFNKNKYQNDSCMCTPPNEHSTWSSQWLSYMWNNKLNFLWQFVLICTFIKYTGQYGRRVQYLLPYHKTNKAGGKKKSEKATQSIYTNLVFGMNKTYNETELKKRFFNAYESNIHINRNMSKKERRKNAKQQSNKKYRFSVKSQAIQHK